MGSVFEEKFLIDICYGRNFDTARHALAKPPVEVEGVGCEIPAVVEKGVLSRWREGPVNKLVANKTVKKVENSIVSSLQEAIGNEERTMDVLGIILARHWGSSRGLSDITPLTLEGHICRRRADPAIGATTTSPYFI